MWNQCSTLPGLLDIQRFSIFPPGSVIFVEWSFPQGSEEVKACGLHHLHSCSLTRGPLSFFSLAALSFHISVISHKSLVRFTHAFHHSLNISLKLFLPYSFAIISSTSSSGMGIHVSSHALTTSGGFKIFFSWGGSWFPVFPRLWPSASLHEVNSLSWQQSCPSFPAWKGGNITGQETARKKIGQLER